MVFSTQVSNPRALTTQKLFEKAKRLLALIFFNHDKFLRTFYFSFLALSALIKPAKTFFCRLKTGKKVSFDP